MGCWNETCALSGLPILMQSDMVLLFVARPFGFADTYAASRRVGPDAFWKPVGFPIYGRYNDYGWIENVEITPLFDFTVRQIESSLVEPEDGSRRETKRQADDAITAFGKLIEDGQLKIGEFDNERARPVGAMMMRRDVFDAMISTYRDDVYGRYDGTPSVANLEYYANEIKSLFLKHGNRPATAANYIAYGYSRLSTQVNYLQPYFRYDDDPNYDLFFAEAAKMIVLECLMQQLRIHYGVRSGAGSQNQDWNFYKRQNDIIGAIIDREIEIERGYDEEFDDEFDEDE